MHLRFICIFLGFDSSFLFIGEYYSIIISSPTEGHLGFFQFSVITSKAAINNCMQVFVGHKFSNWLGKYLGVRLLACMERLHLAFKKLLNCLPKWIYHLGLPTHEWEFLLLLTSSWWCWAFWISVFPVGVEWCLSFNLQFSNDVQCRASFHVFICHLYIIFEVFLQIFCPLKIFVVVLLSLKGSCVFVIRVLYHVFSSSVAHVFILLTVFFRGRCF